MATVQKVEENSQNVQQRTQIRHQKESSVDRFFHQLRKFLIFVGCMSIDID